MTANATMDISAARDGLDMVCALEKAVGRDGADEAIVKWQNLKNKISDYKTDDDGALREWAMEEYTENNNHRHLSHLYVAWPAYDTQKDPELAKAANIALDNRNRFNTGDATAGHGWMHKALVEAAAEHDEGLMEKFFEQDSLTEDEMREGIRKGLASRGMFPVFCVCAGKDMGVRRLMEFLGNVVPFVDEMPPVHNTRGEVVKPDSDGPTSLYFFKTAVEPHIGDVQYFKVMSGKVHEGDDFTNADRGSKERIAQIMLVPVPTVSR